MNKIFCGNALQVLKELPPESVQMCVTSPPYYGLRDYGMIGQLGNEPSPDEYIENLVWVFREIRRVLKHDGTLWLNIADSYAGSGKGIWNKPISERPKSKQIYHYHGNESYANMPSRWDKIKPKDMIGIPWRLAFSLRDDGWYLRSDIIWHKTNCMPEPVKDRPSKSYEHIFLLSKSEKYYYDYAAIAEPVAESTVNRNKRAVSNKGKYAEGIPGVKVAMQPLFMPRSHTDAANVRNKRDVWSCSTNSYRADGHFAVYPEKLIEPCILAGSPVGGVVIDPFFGSGTTGAVAKRMGRQYIGIDLNPDYCKTAEKRINETEVLHLEIKINKEIKDYHESLFFGLSVRQFACSLAAVGAAVGVYFGLSNIVGKETVSWLCIVCAAPLAVAGFFQYNGMNLEQFIAAWFRSEFLCAGVRTYKSENILQNIYEEHSC